MGCKYWFYLVEFKEPLIEGDERTAFITRGANVR